MTKLAISNDWMSKLFKLIGNRSDQIFCINFLVQQVAHSAHKKIDVVASQLLFVTNWCQSQLAGYWVSLSDFRSATNLLKNHWVSNKSHIWDCLFLSIMRNMDQSLSAELEISNLAKFWIVWSKGMWICHFESEASFTGKWKFDARLDIACEAEHPLVDRPTQLICISDIYLLSWWQWPLCISAVVNRQIQWQAEHPLPSHKPSHKFTLINVSKTQTSCS